MLTRGLQLSVNALPWKLRLALKHVPGVASVQRWLILGENAPCSGENHCLRPFDVNLHQLWRRQLSSQDKFIDG